MMDLLRKNIVSYADLPVSLYHFSTKFRHELRAKSGILRGREFLMKDLYSAHVSEEDLMEYYEKVKNAYSKIFARLNLDFKIAGASGGVFTDRITNEFQVIADSGEDTIYYCDKCNWCANVEVFKGKIGDICPECKKGHLLKGNSIEVGHIFSLGPQYAEKMNFYFTDKDGSKKPVWFGSYGIGITRMLGVLVEVSHDDKGIIWNKEIAPFDVHLVELPGAKNAKKIYEELQKNGVEVLWDDRELGAGQKFADADLIGIPVRLVVSEKTGEKVEYKERKSKETKMHSLEETIKMVKLWKG
jgi:prolyl-tRNA synthetase